MILVEVAEGHGCRLPASFSREARAIAVEARSATAAATSHRAGLQGSLLVRAEAHERVAWAPLEHLDEVDGSAQLPVSMLQQLGVEPGDDIVTVGLCGGWTLPAARHVRFRPSSPRFLELAAEIGVRRVIAAALEAVVSVCVGDTISSILPDGSVHALVVAEVEPGGAASLGSTAPTVSFSESHGSSTGLACALGDPVPLVTPRSSAGGAAAGPRQRARLLRDPAPPVVSLATATSTNPSDAMPSGLLVSGAAVGPTRPALALIPPLLPLRPSTACSTGSSSSSAPLSSATASALPSARRGVGAVGRLRALSESSHVSAEDAAGSGDGQGEEQKRRDFTSSHSFRRRYRRHPDDDDDDDDYDDRGRDLVLGIIPRATVAAGSRPPSRSSRPGSARDRPRDHSVDEESRTADPATWAMRELQCRRQQRRLLLLVMVEHPS